MKPVSRLERAAAKKIRYVLMDIDDTLTTKGKLGAAAFDALWRLQAASLKTVPVTGRPAGWCDLIAREWPVNGVVGENGALAFWEDSGQEQSAGRNTRRMLRQYFHPYAVRNDHETLVRVKNRALAEIPGLRVAKDQFGRLFDIALDFAEEDPVLPLEAAVRAAAIAAEEGAQAKISSIHVNVWMGSYDKLRMSEYFLQTVLGWRGDPEEVLFAGDSPNDEPMFARFPSCAVANITRYTSLLERFPAFIASREGGEGFAEIAHTLIARRT
ncbi:MAG: HAD-IIB family hydrolase [Treponema sp.]|jgi:HAD superfamily hydrolase (TIGR01484 family)|nr:HAD-IIB family hydrolase [Treponema sp.]